MSEQQVTLQMIQEAQERLKGVAQKTGLSYSNSVSDLAGCKVFLKLENLQRTGSFKLRGAYNKVASLTPEEREKGVIAASAATTPKGSLWQPVNTDVSRSSACRNMRP